MLIATRKAIDLEKINKRLDKSKHSDECGVCVCVCVFVCVCVCTLMHSSTCRMLSEATLGSVSKNTVLIRVCTVMEKTISMENAHLLDYI